MKKKRGTRFETCMPYRFPPPRDHNISSDGPEESCCDYIRHQRLGRMPEHWLCRTMVTLAAPMIQTTYYGRCNVHTRTANYCTSIDGDWTRLSRKQSSHVSAKMAAGPGGPSKEAPSALVRGKGRQETTSSRRLRFDRYRMRSRNDSLLTPSFRFVSLRPTDAAAVFTSAVLLSPMTQSAIRL